MEGCSSGVPARRIARPVVAPWRFGTVGSPIDVIAVRDSAHVMKESVQCLLVFTSARRARPEGP